MVGVGVGVGSGGGLSEGDGAGGGGDPVGGGVPLGGGAGAGAGAGGGAPTDCVGWSVNSEKSGEVKSRTGSPETADDMKSRQISAGMVPPKTSEVPSTSRSGRFDCRHPTHTHVVSCGT